MNEMPQNWLSAVVNASLNSVSTKKNRHLSTGAEQQVHNLPHIL